MYCHNLKNTLPRAVNARAPAGSSHSPQKRLYFKDINCSGRLLVKTAVYGIGNPLIDILARVDDFTLESLGMNKGIMSLVTFEQRKKILDILEGRGKSYSCGGSCPNTMITLSAMGVKTALGGKTGRDEFGEIYSRQLEKHEHITSALAQCESPTGSSIILITPDSERTMNTFLGANREFAESDVNEKILDDSDIFYFTGYMWDTENQKAAIRKCLDICEKRGIKVAFDVADPFAVNRYRNDFLEIIEKNADYVFANNEEASILFSGADPLKAAGAIAEMGKTGIVKWGKHGSVIKKAKDEPVIIPVIGDKGRFDTTGAGDTYAAGFLYGLCTGKSLKSCGMCASHLASAIVAKTGAQFSESEAASLKNEISRL